MNDLSPHLKLLERLVAEKIKLFYTDVSIKWRELHPYETPTLTYETWVITYVKDVQDGSEYYMPVSPSQCGANIQVDELSEIIGDFFLAEKKGALHEIIQDDVKMSKLFSHLDMDYDS